jgi:hypothetical protein
MMKMFASSGTVIFNMSNLYKIIEMGAIRSAKVLIKYSAGSSERLLCRMGGGVVEAQA